MTEFGRQIRVDAIWGRYSPGNHMVTLGPGPCVTLRPMLGPPGLRPRPQIAVYQLFSRPDKIGKSCEMAFFYAMIQVDSVTVTIPFSRWPACSASGISGLVRKTTESPPLCTRVPRRISWDGSTFLLFFFDWCVWCWVWCSIWCLFVSYISKKSDVWNWIGSLWEPARLPSPWQVAEASTFHLWCLILR